MAIHTFELQQNKEFVTVWPVTIVQESLSERGNNVLHEKVIQAMHPLKVISVGKCFGIVRKPFT